jgi:hypothetical protein
MSHLSRPYLAAVRSDTGAPKTPARAPARKLSGVEKMTSQRATPEQRRERAELDARFGKIGISAVAAAIRYKSDSRNPAYAPAVIDIAEQAEEAAA